MKPYYEIILNIIEKKGLKDLDVYSKVHVLSSGFSRLRKGK